MAQIQGCAVRQALRIACCICAMSAYGQQSSAEELIAVGHWKRACSIVEARIRGSPGDPLANYLLSQIRNAFGEHTTPLPLAEKAVALDGKVAKYHRQLAEVLGVTAQRSGAIQQMLLGRRFRKEIDLALALDPRDTQALRDLVDFYLIAPALLGGDTRKAAAIAQRIQAVDAAEGFLAQARIAEYQKREAEAATLAQQAAQVQPPSYRALIALAQLNLARDSARAEAQAREALKLDRSRSDAHAILAAIYADRCDWNGLNVALAAASEQSPEDRTPYFRAAERLLASGRDLSRAERCLRFYLAQEPEGAAPTAAEAHWKLGQVLRAQGRDTEAIEEWKESARLDPRSPAVRELKKRRLN